ncbi:MAG: hypothetical protein JRI23_22010 [Deltaproteobacteria bacterium]|nr:hypothetical protein [Deltaproteobacteria bacterium]MBW2534634.1 hypothetical protein [Deltaproteobacteria bacterium]
MALLLTAATGSCSDGEGEEHECPAAQPANRSECTSPGLTCDYQGGPCGGSGGEFYRAECRDDGLWIVQYYAEGCD